MVFFNVSTKVVRSEIYFARIVTFTASMKVVKVKEFIGDGSDV